MPNSPYLDILIFAVVAGIILFRLYSVLGRRTGNERPPRDNYRLGGNAPQQAPASSSNVTSLEDHKRAAGKPPTSDPIARGLMDIQLADRSFETEHFLSGARQAYEMIVTAFAAGDRATLKPLLSSEVFSAFDSVIRGRETRGEKVVFTLVGLGEVKIAEASLANRQAEITVSFAAQFVSATLDADGKVIDGDSTATRSVTDVWTFTRDTRSRDPGWTLVATSANQT